MIPSTRVSFCYDTKIRHYRKKAVLLNSNIYAAKTNIYDKNVVFSSANRLCFNGDAAVNTTEEKPVMRHSRVGSCYQC